MTKWMVLSTLLLLLLTLPADASPRQSARNESVECARELWELAINAKGGRTRLHSVENLVLSNEGDLEFYVFPSFRFSWADSRPSAFGVFLHWFNFELDRGYTSFAYETTLIEQSPIKKGYASSVAQRQLELLLETKWFSPVLVSGTRGKISDTVVVKVNYLGYAYRADLLLNNKTHLPSEIRYYVPATDTEPADSMWFHDYIEVDGIMLPSRISKPWLRSKQRTPTAFEINAEYDPEFLTKPPDINAGPYQWRKAR